MALGFRAAGSTRVLMKNQKGMSMKTGAMEGLYCWLHSRQHGFRDYEDYMQICNKKVLEKNTETTDV